MDNTSIIMKDAYLFVIYMRYKNLQRASQKLHMSKGNLSRRLKSYEKNLGLPLFHHEIHKLIPTKEANAFFERINDSFHEIEEAMNRFQTEHVAPCITISLPPTFGKYWSSSPEIFSQNRLPFSLRVLIGTRAPKDQLVDCAVEYIHLDQDFTRDHYYQYQLLGYDSPSILATPELAQKVSSLEDIARYTLIVLECRIIDWYHVFSAAGKLEIYTQAKKYMYQCVEQAYSAAAMGVGFVITTVPLSLLTNEYDLVEAIPFSEIPGTENIVQRGHFLKIPKHSVKPEVATIEAMFRRFYNHHHRNGKLPLNITKKTLSNL